MQRSILQRLYVGASVLLLVLVFKGSYSKSSLQDLNGCSESWICGGAVAHTFNQEADPTQEAEADGTLSSRPVWSTEF